MSPLSNPFNSLMSLGPGDAGDRLYYSLPALEAAGVGPISRLPVCIRVVLESVLRNCDGRRIHESDVRDLANWKASGPAAVEIPFVVARIILQDFTGVPLLVDLAAMRSAVARLGRSPDLIEPLVPVDLVIDHSVQVDRSGSSGAFLANLKIEFERNRERYEFLKWGQQAFSTFKVVPPSVGIVHQVNLEYLADVVVSRESESGRVFFPDTLVGTDSHTTMINGLGIVGWGVGGIEAEAGMLGQPVYFLTPEVVGVRLTGSLGEGVTATDLTLRITELLRQRRVVGKFVEFHGPGAMALSLADRATIANMAPEYGATMGFFPVDKATLDYLASTGRSSGQVELVRDYFQAQNMFGIPDGSEIDYTEVVDVDLGSVVPAVAGPKRPQDRIDMPDMGRRFVELFSATDGEGGFGREEKDRAHRESVDVSSEGVNAAEIGHGSVLIAAITSCTNTSNPSVMLAAGLVAKKAVERGLTVPAYVKTSLAPGSRVVTDYLCETGLQEYLDQIGFNLVGYGCTTCIGNSGPLSPSIEAAIKSGDLIAASVLSGNRNFEARVHSSIKANFLMSPPLVVAYALAGRVDINLLEDPIGTGADGTEVRLRDIWPTNEEVLEHIRRGLKPGMYTKQYGDLVNANPEWNAIETVSGELYRWDEKSTYIQEPPFFDDFSLDVEPIRPIGEMRPLALLGDSVTTDHISPAGSFSADSPAGQYLVGEGVEPAAFNSYGSRRGNDRVMKRGTFANIRIRNQMAEGREGGYTRLMPEGKLTSVFEACETYARRGTPLIIVTGSDYGMGSSRDWAAKGTRLLGVRAVVATSYERIHRSNLVGLGVLPLEFRNGADAASLGLDGSEVFSLPSLGDDVTPGQVLDLVVARTDGTTAKVPVTVRIDTPIEVDYYRHGGILPYVLREILRENP